MGRLRLALVAVLAIVALDSIASAASLFKPAQQAGTKSNKKSAKTFTCNQAAINRKTVQISVNGKTFVAQRDPKLSSKKMFVGSIRKQPGSAVVAGVVDKACFGTLRTQAGIFEFKPVASKSPVVEIKQIKEPRQVASAGIPSGGGRRLLQDMEMLNATFGRRLLGPAGPVKVIIDVLLVATDSATFAVGGWDDMKLSMATSVQLANKALSDSGVNAALRVANYIQLFTPADDSDVDEGTILKKLKDSKGTSDATVATTSERFSLITDPTGAAGAGNSLEGAGWRDTYGADLVVVYTKLPGFGSIGYINNGVTGKADFMYALLLASSLQPGYALAQAVGYNLGCGIGASDRTGAEYKTWAVGYKQCRALPRFYDIMNTPCENAFSIQAPLYAAPELRYKGMPAGDKKDGNCAAALRITGPIAAAFKTPPTTPPVQLVMYKLYLCKATAVPAVITPGPSTEDYCAVLQNTWSPTLGVSSGANVWSIPNLELYEINDLTRSFKLEIYAQNYDAAVALDEARPVFYISNNYGTDVAASEIGYDIFGPESYIGVTTVPIKSQSFYFGVTTLTDTTAFCNNNNIIPGGGNAALGDDTTPGETGGMKCTVQVAQADATGAWQKLLDDGTNDGAAVPYFPAAVVPGTTDAISSFQLFRGGALPGAENLG